MDFFLLNKQFNLEDNVLWVAKTCYELLDQSYHLDELFNKYIEQEDVQLNLNLERILYLALSFLYSLELVKIKNNRIEKV
ncbi:MULTISPECIES: hypothetical protein [Bacillus]|jgi:hypothetical protein|uniref:Uncharacterized protein n=2 Tax=Bacillus cereus group TaxID=86661 RepID=Q72ZU1_BACC1|nr:MULTISPECIES: hypothetical protein [Bacillus]AAS43477.1 conserved hypothetical protein [Bacillus cereus ATCC 10987]AIE81595.1 YydC [Bacillus cereus]KMQ36503.1 hypothetical protein TU53_03555 [Bacillus cereus]KXY78709.1 hypothetical protein AT272_03465 [Bacillus cereus]MCU9941652.1 hypothetical protein [Bacillus pacificus]